MKKIVLPLVFCCLSLGAFAQTNASSPANDQDDTPKVPPRKGVSYRVGPSMLDFKLDRGESKSQNMMIVNKSSTQSYRFEMSLEGFNRDTLGNHTVLDPKSSRSCADWVTFDKEFVELEPLQSTVVVVTMHVPDNEEAVNAMKWAKLNVSTESEPTFGHKTSKINPAITPKATIGIHIYQTPPGMSKDIKMLSFKQMNDSTYRIACKNTGGTQLKCDFSIELSNPGSTDNQKVVKNEIPLFPDQLRYVDLVIPKDVKKGKYNIVAMIDAKDEDVSLEVAQLSIEVK